MGTLASAPQAAAKAEGRGESTYNSTTGTTAAAKPGPADSTRQSPQHGWLQATPVSSTPPVYESVLGPRHMMSIKISTRHHPEDLRPGALDRLARLVERWEPGHKEQDTDTEVDNNRTRPSPQVVLHTSVRRGCILLSLDTCQPAASSSSAQFTAAQVLAYAQQVLPSLLTDLGLGQCSDDSGKGHVSGEIMTAPTPLLEPGQYLQLHLGGHVVQASMDRHTQTWVFEVESAECGSTSTQLCLAQPHPTVAAAPAAAGSSPSTMHTVHFSVQVRQQQPSDYLFVRGSDPAADPAHDSDKPGLQLWVHCQGQYLRTVVEEVNSYTGRVEAVVQVPASALARHHQPDGPTARLQLLTAELWQGPATVLSSTPLLLDTARHMQPAVQTTFGWWGASSTAVAGLVSEVSALTAHVVDSPADTAVHSHQAFVSDLATWLSTVQHAAPGTCCDMCEPASPGRATLTPNQCTALADSLRQHASQDCMHLIARVLATQQQVVTAQPPRLPALLRGSLCAECDSTYYNRLCAHLHVSHGWTNLVLGIWMLVGIPRLSPGTPVLFPALLSMMCATRLLRFAHCMFSSPARVQPASRLVKGLQRLDSCMMLVALWALHLIIELFASSVPVVAPRGSVAFVLVHSWLALLGHQVPVWGCVSPWVLRLLWCVEAWLHLCAAGRAEYMQRGPIKWWYVGGVVVVPWMMHVYWRRMLKVPAVTRAGRGIQKG